MAFCCDDNGNFYISQNAVSALKVYDPNGHLIRVIATEGRQEGEVMVPHGIVVDKKGQIVIVDSSNHRIQFFSNEGKFLRRIFSKYNMRCPSGVALTKTGNIVVLDAGEDRIQIFS